MLVEKHFTSRALWPALIIVGLLFTPPPGLAHPMGNFSISHYASIHVERDSVELRYIIDMAEISTFQEMQQTGIAARVEDPNVAAYLAHKAETLKSGLLLEINGHPLEFTTESREIIFPPGAGGLPTMKLGFLFRANLPRTNSDVAHLQFHYRDNNFPDRAGWKEVVAAAGPGVAILSSSVSDRDRSMQLSNYPTDLLNSPPQNLEAMVSFRLDSAALAQSQSSKFVQRGASGKAPPADTHSPWPASNKLASKPINGKSLTPNNQRPTSTLETQVTNSAATGPVRWALGANRQQTPRNKFTELIAAKRLGFWILLAAAAVAAGLGALHALEPGHGKTIVAAYLVGARGTAHHAFLLGMIVTASHTAGVYLLGAVTLYASRYIVPERLYPWLGAISGFIIAALGLYLFMRRYAGQIHSHSHEHVHIHGNDGHRPEHEHSHEHFHVAGHEHAIHGHAHDHSHGGHHHHVTSAENVSYRQLLALGITGGIVPCPAALVVLLSAVALHRIMFGLFLILAFSVGLAAVLISIGLLMVYARRFMSRLHSDGPLVTRWLPLASAAVITILGVTIAIRALMTAGILQVRI